MDILLHDEYDLPDDMLGKIFQMLPVQEVFNVESVRKSWQRVVSGSHFLTEIDIEEWSKHHQPDQIDMMLRILIARSCGSPSKVCVTGLPNDSTFSLIANNAKNLQILRLPRGGMTNSISEQAGMFSKLTFLDVSYCNNIGAQALEAIGKHCKSLTGLKRVMYSVPLYDQLAQDDEALAIANTMRKLKTLEIENWIVGTSSIIKIITKCRELELLNVLGCYEVNLEKDFVEKFPKLQVIGPRDEDHYWDWDADQSDSYMACEFNIDDSDYDYDEIMDGSFEDEDFIDTGEV